MFIRYASAVTSGTFMTLALFYIMQTLIHMGPLDPVESVPNGTLIFTSLIDEEPVRPRDPLPQREKLTNVEKTPPRPPHTFLGPGVGVKLRPPLPPPGPTKIIDGWMHDGPLVAIVRVEPAYPIRAAESGLEGYVIVRFDVNPDGTVTNATVVHSSHKVFEKAALKAAARFRYKARVVDGVAQATYGLESRFTFEMERG
jgi:periplasmic protein TonB